VPARTSRRRTYSAGNWTVEAEGGERHPDRLFSIDSPGSCHVQLALFAGHIQPATIVDEQVKALAATVRSQSVRRDPAARWGAYAGESAEVRGTAEGTPPLTARIFAYGTPTRSFTVVEYCYDEDLPRVEPGFALVRSTFQLR
jgi:hypothetical protein